MIRRTKQRDAILKALEGAGRPLSPNEIHTLGQAHFSALGLRTVYRNIRELAEVGRLVGVDYPGQPLRYELADGGDFKPHFICRYCENVYPLAVPLPDIVFSPPPGFSVEGEEVVFYGRCPECAV